MQIIYTYELMTIHYISENNLLQVEWQGFVASQDYRHIMKKMAQLTIELNIQNWIFNISQAEALQIGDLIWTTEYLGPLMKGNVLKKVARVDDKKRELLNDLKLIIADAIIQYNLSVAVEFFDDVASALNWLKEETISAPRLEPVAV